MSEQMGRGVDRLVLADTTAGARLDPDEFYATELASDTSRGSARFIALVGGSDGDRSDLLRWIAARSARGALAPGGPAPVPLLLDMARLDPVFARIAGTDAKRNDELLRLMAEAQIGSWVRAPSSPHEGAIWLLDRVDVLGPPVLRDVAAAVVRQRARMVLACSSDYWTETLRDELARISDAHANVAVAVYAVERWDEVVGGGRPEPKGPFA